MTSSEAGSLVRLADRRGPRGARRHGLALMLVDASILLHAVDASSPQQQRTARWLSEQLSGDKRVGFPWQSIVAFVRIATHAKAAWQPRGRLARPDSIGSKPFGLER